jgi:protease-4
LQQINRFIERKGEHLLKPLETWDSAIVSKLVHSSCSLTDFHHYVRTRFDPSKYPIVKWKDYSGIITGRESQKKYNGNIGVLFIEGKILDGQKPSSFSISQQRGESSYSFDVIRLLKKAYNDDSLDAVLLLVNSPGGSATAAAMILEELEKLNKKKPVYVRMTEVAASGGYMISLASNKIICNESTLTGSIGALAGKPVIRELLEKLGISIHNITSGLDTSLNDISKEWTEKEFALVSEQSERVYTEFKNYVARHRNLSLDQVDQLAEGRIWTGLSAKQGGLVDDTGGHLSIVAFLKDLIQGKNQKQTTSPISNEEISLEFKSLHSPISSIAQLLFKGDDSADPNKSDSMI